MGLYLKHIPHQGMHYLTVVVVFIIAIHGQLCEYVSD